MVCVMSGTKSISPSNKYFAFIYSPDEMAHNRYLWILNLSNFQLYNEESLPALDSEVVGVKDFAWFDDSSLLVNLYAGDNWYETEISIWMYNL